MRLTAARTRLRLSIFVLSGSAAPDGRIVPTTISGMALHYEDSRWVPPVSRLTSQKRRSSEEVT